MPNLANINVTITATDATGPAVSSAKSNLSSLGASFSSIGSIASGVFGGILGFSVFRTLASGIGNVVSSAFSLNNSLSASEAASRSMVNAIADSEKEGTSSFGALSAAARNFEKTMREIRERESDGLTDYADKIDDIKQKLLDARQEQDAAAAKSIAQQKQQLAELAQDHQETIDDLNTRILNEGVDFNEKLYDMNNSRQDKLDNLEDSHSSKVENINKKLVDAQEDLLTATTAFDQQRAQSRINSLNAELVAENAAYSAEETKINERADHEVQVETDKHNREIASLQLRLTRENAEYEAQKIKINQRAADDIAQDKKTADAKVANLTDQLAKQEAEHKRFLRDIAEAYADANAKLEVGSGGGGAGGKRTIDFQFDFGDSFRDLTGSQIDKFLNDVQQKYVEIGVKSPFNVGDIQNFGKSVIQYTGASVDNMETLLTLGQALAAKNPMQGMLGATQSMVELLGSGNITSLTKRFDLPKAALANLSDAKSADEMISLLAKDLSGLGITADLIEAKTHTLGGSWENFSETFKLVTAEIAKPVWQFLTDKLIELNTWLFANRETIEAWGKAIGGIIADAIVPLIAKFIEFGGMLKTFWSDHGAKITELFGKWTDMSNSQLVPGLNLLRTIWLTVQEALETTIIPGMERIFATLGRLWTEIAPEIKKTLDFLSQWWKDNSDTIMATVKFAWAVIEFVIKSAIDIIKLVIKVGLAAIRGDWESVFKAIETFGRDMFNNFAEFVKGVWDAIGSHVRNGINDVIDKINNFIKGVNQIKVKVGGTELGFSIPGIPKLAAGGIVNSPTLALIGEGGPEAVVPLNRGLTNGGGVNIYVTGNTVLNENNARDLAQVIGKAFVNELQLQGRYT